MSLVKFQTALHEEFPELGQEIATFLEVYIAKEKAEYKDNKKDNKLTFGKFKGYSILELSTLEKGKDYLQWVLSQTWVDDEKWAWFRDECKRLKVVKKTTKRLPLSELN